MTDSKNDEQILETARRNRNNAPKVTNHIFPARFRTEDWERLRTFLHKVSDVALEMGVKFEAIEPETDEDLKALMKLIGASQYSGTFKLDDPLLAEKVENAPVLVKI